MDDLRQMQSFQSRTRAFIKNQTNILLHNEAFFSTHFNVPMSVIASNLYYCARWRRPSEGEAENKSIAPWSVWSECKWNNSV